MAKEYIVPKIKVRRLDYSSPLLDTSLVADDPTSDLPGGNNPTMGGSSSGGRGGTAGSRRSIWTSDF